MIEGKGVTDLIHRAVAGDADAAETLLKTTYGDLRALARARLTSGRRGAMLDTTTLVHEWYLRFSKANDVRIEDRGHYMRYASKVMRSVIVDFIRRRQAERRGGGADHVPLNDEIDTSGESEITGVHEALERLAAFDERMGAIVEMRYFGGLNEAEIAEALDVSERTVRRDWAKARLWLAEALR